MIKVFDYLCNNCKAVDEYWLKNDEKPQCRNPDCKSTDMKKLPSATRTNWYRTPYEEFL
jgi:hypothetical protein